MARFLLVLFMLITIAGFLWFRPVRQMNRRSVAAAASFGRRLVGPKTFDSQPIKNRISTSTSWYAIRYKPQISGPIVDKHNGFEYYDVVWPTSYVIWDVYNSDVIVDHWINTLPPHVQPSYSYLAPKIFFHGRKTDPYLSFMQAGYFADDGRSSLWTVAITYYSRDIRWCEQPWNRFVVVFKLRQDKGDKDELLITNQIKTDVPLKFLFATQILGRVGYQYQNAQGDQDITHPDSYVFTRDAQLFGNAPIEISRVYRLLPRQDKRHPVVT